MRDRPSDGRLNAVHHKKRANIIWKSHRCKIVIQIGSTNSMSTFLNMNSKQLLENIKNTHALKQFFEFVSYRHADWWFRCHSPCHPSNVFHFNYFKYYMANVIFPFQQHISFQLIYLVAIRLFPKLSIPGHELNIHP